MSKITLTDRISVSVRAKTDAQSSQQKVDTGKNIANALGVDDYNDTDAATIGNTSKPTITDENGNEWVSIQDIIDAGKKMHQDGAFATKYKGMTENGITYVFDPVYSGTTVFPIYQKSADIGKDDVVRYRWIIPPGCLWALFNFGRNNSGIIVFSKNEFTWRNEYVQANGNVLEPASNTYSGSPITATINGVRYSFFVSSITGGTASGVSSDPNLAGGLYFVGASGSGNASMSSKYAAATLFGNISGGSLIDWTKPDDEIEEDIRQLHETWDVSEHEGAVTANGTYVLAGPIEYNDADPDSHSSGDF